MVMLPCSRVYSLYRGSAMRTSYKESVFDTLDLRSCSAAVFGTSILNETKSFLEASQVLDVYALGMHSMF